VCEDSEQEVGPQAQGAILLTRLRGVNGKVKQLPFCDNNFDVKA